MYRERNRIERMIGHLKINRLSPRDMTSSPAPSSTRFILPLSADANSETGEGSAKALGGEA
jgi:hypothetical protein